MLRARASVLVKSRMVTALLAAALSSGATWSIARRDATPMSGPGAPGGRERCDAVERQLAMAERAVRAQDRMSPWSASPGAGASPATAQPNHAETDGAIDRKIAHREAAPDEVDPTFDNVEWLEATQVDDPAWSRPTEHKLESLARSTDLAPERFSVRCGRELCRVDIGSSSPAAASPDSGGAREVARFLALAYEVLPASYSRDGGGRLTAIFVRAGTMLDGADGGGASGAE
jgi:hypothetical protein